MHYNCFLSCLLQAYLCVLLLDLVCGAAGLQPSGGRVLVQRLRLHQTQPGSTVAAWRRHSNRAPPVGRPLAERHHCRQACVAIVPWLRQRASFLAWHLTVLLLSDVHWLSYTIAGKLVRNDAMSRWTVEAACGCCFIIISPFCRCCAGGCRGVLRGLHAGEGGTIRRCCSRRRSAGRGGGVHHDKTMRHQRCASVHITCVHLYNNNKSFAGILHICWSWVGPGKGFVSTHCNPDISVWKQQHPV